MPKVDIHRVLTRRRFLGGTVAFGTGAFFNMSNLPARTSRRQMFDFTPVRANSFDTITIPSGFKWSVVASWGDPLWSDAAEFDHNTRGNGASQEMSIGDNNDGMALFEIRGHSVLVVNNEYCNNRVIYGNRSTLHPENSDDIRKGIAAHGVSVFEIKRHQDNWAVVKDSFFNRRITAESKMQITGPASGHDLLKTELDPSGKFSLGTFNNCGNGRTPWGTYLACEENFDKYFSTRDKSFRLTAEQIRYGLTAEDAGYGWANKHERFDLAKHPNEANRVGYVVEIDPGSPFSVPKKRTAMGRFKHENCEITICKNGQVAAYMGDDQRGEFLYKFISKNKFSENGNNTDLLEYGDLYAAVFDSTGRGNWVNLLDSGMSRPQTLVNSRIAATRVGATTMDRPEWVSANPFSTEVYCCLTNNSVRGTSPSQPLNAANPRVSNHYGQIIRWKPDNNDHGSNNFEWDHFLLAGNPALHDTEYAGTNNINTANMFNSPDGLSFDSLGNLWIQTDGNYSNEGPFKGMGNNQMLMADTITGKIKRFLVGPRECEVTGITWSADRSTMFVGIQHPGEKNPLLCGFPGGKGTVPRSSIVAISRDDGGAMG